jgi:hypothetical protein
LPSDWVMLTTTLLAGKAPPPRWLRCANPSAAPSPPHSLVHPPLLQNCHNDGPRSIYPPQRIRTTLLAPIERAKASRRAPIATVRAVSPCRESGKGREGVRECRMLEEWSCWILARLGCPSCSIQSLLLSRSRRLALLLRLRHTQSSERRMSPPWTPLAMAEAIWGELGAVEGSRGVRSSRMMRRRRRAGRRERKEWEGWRCPLSTPIRPSEVFPRAVVDN